MKKLFVLSGALLLMTYFAAPLLAQCSGAKARLASSQPDIVGVAMSSKAHTTLVAAVKAAGLVETLQGEGPFTVFAPTNAAFEALPEGTVAYLLKPENKAKLSAVLTYHVVPGKLTAEKVLAAIKAGGGTTTVTTVNGGKLQAMAMDGAVYLKDAQGNTSKVSQTDLMASNGVIHVIDSVVMP